MHLKQRKKERHNIIKLVDEGDNKKIHIFEEKSSSNQSLTSLTHIEESPNELSFTS